MHGRPRLGRHHTRIRGIRDRFVHEVANRLVNTHDRIALEDLNITGMLTNHRLAAAVSDAAWAALADRIRYKQQWRGGQVCAVNRWFPSSKTCSRCRAVVGVLPLAQRVFHCDRCGHAQDRDLNAAVNLAVWAEEYDAQTRDDALNQRCLAAGVCLPVKTSCGKVALQPGVLIAIVGVLAQVVAHYSLVARVPGRVGDHVQVIGDGLAGRRAAPPATTRPAPAPSSAPSQASGSSTSTAVIQTAYPKSIALAKAIIAKLP
jgi:IS605 OrfB family transposase